MILNKVCIYYIDWKDVILFLKNYKDVYIIIKY